MSFFQNACKPKGVGGKIMLMRMNKRHANMAQWGFSHIHPDEGNVCLDIGCGGGMNVKTLLKLCKEGKVVGVDYSAISVGKSTKVNRVEISKGRCEIMQGDVRELPFDSQSFDLVTAFETIYFWDVAKGFSEVHRVLKDGGTFMICNEANGDNPDEYKMTEIIQGMAIYTDKQIEDLLQAAGFNDIKIDKKQSGWICVLATK